MSTDYPCDFSSWLQFEPGQAWIAAMEKDFEEVGPIPGYDDDLSYGKPLSEIPGENQASLYGDWYMGLMWGKVTVTKDEFYRIAPNRSKYMEDYFGLPPR